MKMEFIFDEEKLKQEGYTLDACLNVIRKHFAKFSSPTIRETRQGFFEGAEEDKGAFGSTTFLPHTKWFLKVIKEWYWYIDEGDGKGEQKEDGLKAFYELKAGIY